MTHRVIKWPKWLVRPDFDRYVERISGIINSSEYRGLIQRGYCDGIEHQYRCPYGAPGDQLILGTTWSAPKEYDNLKPTELPVGYLAGLPVMTTSGTGSAFNPIPIWSYFDSDEKHEGFVKLRPGMFFPNKLRDRMPRETLKVVRAKRVQGITEEEAILEGIFETPRDPGFDCWSTYGMREYYPTPRDAFRALWDSIFENKGYGWDSNPWVWCLGW
jgi:hypothetical protein